MVGRGLRWRERMGLPGDVLADHDAQDARAAQALQETLDDEVLPASTSATTTGFRTAGSS